MGGCGVSVPRASHSLAAQPQISATVVGLMGHWGDTGHSACQGPRRAARSGLGGTDVGCLTLACPHSHSTVPHFVGLGSQPANLWRQHANEPPWAVAQEESLEVTSAQQPRGAHPAQPGGSLCVWWWWRGARPKHRAAGVGPVVVVEVVVVVEGGHIPALRCRRGAE